MNANKKSLGAKVQAAESAKPQAAEGRDATGKFTKGNAGGPGNPFARQTAAYRKAMRAMVTEQEIRELSAMLILKARSGDLAAAKLLLQYCVGKPAETTDPDRLDVEEWRLLQESMADADGLETVLMDVPVQTVVILLRAVMPFLVQGLLEQLKAGLLGKPKKAKAAPVEEDADAKFDRELFAGMEWPPKEAGAEADEEEEEEVHRGGMEGLAELLRPLVASGALPWANGGNGDGAAPVADAPGSAEASGPMRNGRNGKEARRNGRKG